MDGPLTPEIIQQAIDRLKEDEQLKPIVYYYVPHDWEEYHQIRRWFGEKLPYGFVLLDPPDFTEEEEEC